MSVNLTQTQQKYQFDLDVDVTFRYADGSMSTVTSIKMPTGDGAPAQASYPVPAGKQVVDMIIDPGTRLLATWNITALPLLERHK